MPRLKPIQIGSISCYPLWFDSMGAKSSSLLIKTPDIAILVDPGAAEMQPSYPLPSSEKRRLRYQALQTIKEAAQEAEIVFISHYHYDHHTLPSEAKEIYEGKKLWIKNPNLWINRSQWNRARLFLSQLYEMKGEVLSSRLKPPEKIDLKDPLLDLPLASNKDFGDYRERKNELLTKGRGWFKALVKLWLNEPWVSQAEDVIFADGLDLKFGATKIKITSPLFHGAEYDRVGWVVGLVLEYGGRKILYSSDLQGPIIEDYAAWIIEEAPDVLFLDGPATYLLGYMLNQINLRRAIGNLCSILKNTATSLIIYDHHLLREARFKERTAEAYQVAKEEGKTLITAAEWLGEPPLISKITKE